MRTIWHSLAWKEWHEHKWKLAAMTAIVSTVTLLPLVDFDRAAFAGVSIVAVLCVGPLAVFIGTAEAAGERSRGTLPFAQALPIPMWKVAVPKLFFGLVTCVLPVLITIAAVCGIYLACRKLEIGQVTHLIKPFVGLDDVVGVGEWFTTSALIATTMAAGLFLWTAAVGANRKDEVSAGAWSLLAMAAWWIAVNLLVSRTGGDEQSSNAWLSALYAASPGGQAALEFRPWFAASRWLTLPIALVFQAALALWYVKRFGRADNQENRSPTSAATDFSRPGRIAAPRRSPIAAIAWKQCRESGPIVLAGLAGIAGTVVLFMLGDPSEYDVRTGALLVAAVTAYFGVVVSLVVGIGVFLHDLTPQLNTFWRSRPINPDAWFWTKLIAGLGVLIVSFSVPLMVGGIASYGHPDFGEMAVFALLVPVWIYTAALLMTCLVRHAVYAAILSVAVIYIGVVLVELVRLLAILVGWVARPEGDLWDLSTAEVAAAMISTIVVSTLVGWLAVRYDWGRKSRY